LTLGSSSCLTDYAASPTSTIATTTIPLSIFPFAFNITSITSYFSISFPHSPSPPPPSPPPPPSSTSPPSAPPQSPLPSPPPPSPQSPPSPPPSTPPPPSYSPSASAPLLRHPPASPSRTASAFTMQKAEPPRRGRLPSLFTGQPISQSLQDRPHARPRSSHARAEVRYSLARSPGTVIRPGHNWQCR
jgi:hypothetical protein